VYGLLHLRRSTGGSVALAFLAAGLLPLRRRPHGAAHGAGPLLAGFRISRRSSRVRLVEDLARRARTEGFSWLNSASGGGGRRLRGVRGRRRQRRRPSGLLVALAAPWAEALVALLGRRTLVARSA
jgi:hypothetical protein